MARRPLYPNLPGEQALDRLLNQTLPNLIQQREAKLERDRDREDRLEQQRINNQFNQETLNIRRMEIEDKYRDEASQNIHLRIDTAEKFFEEGKIEQAITILDGTETSAKNGKYTKDIVETYNFDSYRKKYDDGLKIENGMKAVDDAYVSEGATYESTKAAHDKFMTDIYPSLSSGQREIYNNSLREYAKGNERIFGWYEKPEYDMESHNAIIEAKQKYANYTPDTIGTPTDLAKFEAGLENYSENGIFFDKLTPQRQQEVRNEQFFAQYGDKVQNNAESFLDVINSRYDNPDEVGRWLNALPEKQRNEMLKEIGTAVFYAEGVQTNEEWKKSLKDRGVPEDLIGTAIGQKITEKDEKDGKDVKDEVTETTKLNLDEMSENQRYEYFGELQQKDFYSLKEEEKVELTQLIAEFGSATNPEMTAKIGKQRRKNRKYNEYQGYIDNYTNTLKKYQELLELGPVSGQGPEATYRAPKGMFVGGKIIKKKEIDIKIRQLTDQIARNKLKQSKYDNITEANWLETTI